MTSKVNQINTKICLKIKMERIKRGWSQDQLAEYSNLSKVSIGKIERGKSTPTAITLAKIAEAFGMSVSELTDISRFIL